MALGNTTITAHQFLELINQHKESQMNEIATDTGTEAVLTPATPLTDDELKALLARTGTEVAVTSDEGEVTPLSVH